ncbi:Sortase family protein [Micromonospora viridifaciens]|uniref:Sortase family protein n=1 Tax=Micromonospora viridifaciens TaxID=1881 RepID=A0A1C4VGD3_MICVI|nr:Sortase family protein [Micromonospora viridifaciens]
MARRRRGRRRPPRHAGLRLDRCVPPDGATAPPAPAARPGRNGPHLSRSSGPHAPGPLGQHRYGDRRPGIRRRHGAAGPGPGLRAAPVDPDHHHDPPHRRERRDHEPRSERGRHPPGAPTRPGHEGGLVLPGASPGEAGNAVIVGHVDSAKLGPAVFFNLGALQPGDAISVAREDGSTATFTVESVKSYPKATFPTELVYGPADRPGLRVVTCGGAFDQGAGSYVDNVIAFATMTR